MVITQNILYSFLSENKYEFNILKENFQNGKYIDKKQYIISYFHLLEKQYLKEGIINLVKSFVAFCFRIVSSIKQLFQKLKNNIGDKAKQTRISKFLEKDKDLKTFFNIGKSLIKNIVSVAVYKKVGIWKIFTFTSSYLTSALSMVGLTGTLPSIIVTIVSFTVMSKIISIIIKLFSTILGAIKKWALNDSNIEKESMQLAQFSINANRQIINSLEGQKKIQSQKKLNEKIKKFQEYKKKLNNKKNDE